MRALRFERNLARYAAARVAGAVSAGSGARVGPLTLVDIDEPALPTAGWQRVQPVLSGICGSDLATVDGHSSRYFEAIVSFPFVPGHEVVGLLDDGTRVVLEPVLACAARGLTPPCRACAAGQIGRCEHLTLGHLKPGLQTGYCTDTGGGWSGALVAHESQLHAVPDDLSDDAAVMVEPVACGVHGALRAEAREGDVVAVIGAGTLGLCVIAALHRFAEPVTVIAAAKHPEQRAWSHKLGAELVVEPSELARAVRRATRTLAVGTRPHGRLAGGADVTIDCVGSPASLAQALAVTRPGGRIVLVGMPAPERVDLTPLWQREIDLRGAYAYGVETIDGQEVRTFDLAFDLVRTTDLGGLVSARYPLDRYREALDHAAHAGGRGAVKIVFDLSKERRR
jgi:threonine dehydrogenase-like Zn-dependent dehydrogenase